MEARGTSIVPRQSADRRPDPPRPREIPAFMRPPVVPQYALNAARKRVRPSCVRCQAIDRSMLLSFRQSCGPSVVPTR